MHETPQSVACDLYSCHVGPSAALCGGFLPALGVSNDHGGRTEPLLERGAAASLQVTTEAVLQITYLQCSTLIYIGIDA